MHDLLLMSVEKVLTITRDQAIAFRLASHNLARRLPAGELLKAAGACGIQNSPPGSAALALYARVEGLNVADVERALIKDKSLLQAWSMRASPHMFPTVDAAVFTVGLLPVDEKSLQFFIQGMIPALELLDMSAIEALDLTSVALREGLNGLEMTKKMLAPLLADRIMPLLSKTQQTAWKSPSSIVPGQALGETVVRFCLYVCGLTGQLCFGKRQGNQALLALTDQWLDKPKPRSNVGDARAELARRYLHCYGPSTAQHFSEWAGIAPEQAKMVWQTVGEELIEVDFEGLRAWLLRDDMIKIESPRPAEGVRFLPPHEPFLQLRDRETLIHDGGLQKKVWKTLHNPGIVLVEGRPAGTWTSRKTGKLLNLEVKGFPEVSAVPESDIYAEAEAMAAFLGSRSLKVFF